jgi:hypothetical protein
MQWKSVLRTLCGFALLSITVGAALAQTNVNIPPTTIQVTRWTPNQGSETYTINGSSYEIGRSDISSGYSRYRTLFKFSFSGYVPNDAQINSATLILTISNSGNGSYTARLAVAASNADQQSASDMWNSLAPTVTYFNNLAYNNTVSRRLSSDPLKADVQNALSVGKFNVGFTSNNEGSSDSWADGFISYLEVNYTPRIDVTIRNNFGGGTFKADGVTTNSPHTFRWVVGSSHTLEAYNQQQYVFSTWRNASTGQNIPGNPITVAPTVATTYEAQFAINRSITVRNSFDGGFIHVDG